MQAKRILAALVAAATIFATAVPALADGHHGDGEHGDGEHGDREHQHQHFDDLDGAEWAQLNIEKAYQLGLMLGEGDRHFSPHRAISRETAIIAAIRLMGLTDEAKAATGANLHFTDNKRIDTWAAGYISVAVDKNILPSMGDGLLRPQEPASRLWVSVLLVKALGYDAEAQSKMNVQLSFEDADQIPPNLVGYVAAAVDHKLVAGYDDDTFKPNRPVTRAEMAALLARGDSQLGHQKKRAGQLQGTVQSVDVTNGALTIKGQFGTVSASLAPDAAIFVDNKPAQLSAVQVGMSIWVKLNAQMQITLIDAKAADSGNPGQGQTVSGTVTAVLLPQNGGLGALSIQPATGTAITAAVAPQAQITGPNGAITMADIHIGDAVQAELIAGIITKVAVTSNVTTTVQGRVVSITMPATGSGNVASTAGTITIAPDNGGSYVTADLASTVAVTIKAADGTVQNGTLANVTVGSEVQATLQSGVATALQVIVAPSNTVQGKVLAFSPPTSTAMGVITIAPDAGGNSVGAVLSSNVPVTLKAADGTVTAGTLANVTVGSEVQATLNGAVVTALQVNLGQTGTVQGKVVSITLPSGNSAGIITIAPNAGGSNVTAALTSNVSVTLKAADGTVQAGTLANVTVGADVQATLNGAVVTALQVNLPQTSTVQGKVLSFVPPSSTLAGNITIAPDAGGNAVTAVVTSNTAVQIKQSDGTVVSGNLSSVTVNSQVKATLTGGVATTLQVILPQITTVQGKVMYFAAPSGSTAGTLILLPTGANAAVTYSIAANVPVIQGNVSKTFADVTMNSSVLLTLQSGVVTQIQIIG